MSKTKIEQPDYEAMLDYIVDTIGATVSEDDDKKVYDAIMESAIPHDITVKYLVTKMRDLERDSHYGR